MAGGGDESVVTFETVTVDQWGAVTARSCGQCQVMQEDLDGVGLEMVVVPGGSFLMGSGPGEGYEDERPRHPVTVPAFHLGRYPVTQEQWRAVMGSLPRVRCRGERRPVDRVSWYDAGAFCARLSQRTGRAYRLPSEAEWEYACRAGTMTAFCYGPTISTDLANYVGEHVYRGGPKGVYRHESTDVGAFPANAFGLHDMHGNVWEWCADAWHGDYTGAPTDGSAWLGPDGVDRAMRGGCWHDPPDICRSAARLRQRPVDGEDFYGFRVALSEWAPAEPGGAASPAAEHRSAWSRLRAWGDRFARKERS